VKVTLLSPALRDILSAVEYYEEQAAGLGNALDADLTGSVDLIQSMPQLGAPFEAGTRRILLQRFPYAIVYKILDDRILVVAVAHQKQRPGYWRERV